MITWKGYQIAVSRHMESRMEQRRITKAMVLETLQSPSKVEHGHERKTGVTHKIWRKLPNGKRHCVVIACDDIGHNELITTYTRGNGWKFR